MESHLRILISKLCIRFGNLHKFKQFTYLCCFFVSLDIDIEGDNLNLTESSTEAQRMHLIMQSGYALPVSTGFSCSTISC